MHGGGVLRLRCEECLPEQDREPGKEAQQAAQYEQRRRSANGAWPDAALAVGLLVPCLRRCLLGNRIDVTTPRCLATVIRCIHDAPLSLCPKGWSPRYRRSPLPASPWPDEPGSLSA